MPKSFLPLTLQLPDMIDSVTSETSISNFVAQTPKDHRVQNQFKKISIPLLKQNQHKQNNSQASNLLYPLDSRNNKYQLPYKMISSQLPSPCTNHPQKQSSFCIQSDEKQLIFYCQKCAILVASQGFTVKKIESTYEATKKQRPQQVQQSTATTNTPRLSIKSTKTIKKSKLLNEIILSKEQKQTQLTSFLNKLQRIQTRMDKMFESNESQLVEIDTLLQDEVKRIKDVFGKLHGVLDEFQQFYYNDVEGKSQRLRQPLETEIQELTNDSNTLESMNQDICHAYDDIINQTTTSQFETVMNAYNENVQNVQNSLQQRETINTYKSGQLLKAQVKTDIQPQDIINALRKQMQSLLEPPKRPSVKSSQRRISINTNQIR